IPGPDAAKTPSRGAIPEGAVSHSELLTPVRRSGEKSPAPGSLSADHLDADDAPTLDRLFRVPETSSPALSSERVPAVPGEIPSQQADPQTRLAAPLANRVPSHPGKSGPFLARESIHSRSMPAKRIL